MLKAPGSLLRLLLSTPLLLALIVGTSSSRRADACPTEADQIATDRPDITNSSLVVPRDSLQAENGVDWTIRHGSNALDVTNTRLRLGIADCAELLMDVPSYFGSLNGSQPSGFSDVVVSFKRQLPVPYGFDLSATGGVGFPTGEAKIAGRGYQPYLQFPWSHGLAPDWELAGMFTALWSPSESAHNLTFQPTLSVETELGQSADLFLEYVGDFDHQPPAHLLDGGGAWRLTKNQQIDFHVGVGLNRSSPTLNGVPVAQYFGIGYSIRFDGVFGRPVVWNPP
jgi:outer membrane putative beta-barrel porin/alpha-amylase